MHWPPFGKGHGLAVGRKLAKKYDTTYELHASKLGQAGSTSNEWDPPAKFSSQLASTLGFGPLMGRRVAWCPDGSFTVLPPEVATAHTQLTRLRIDTHNLYNG